MPRNYLRVSDCPEPLDGVLNILNGCPRDRRGITDLARTWMGLFEAGNSGIVSLHLYSIREAIAEEAREVTNSGKTGHMDTSVELMDRLIADSLDQFPAEELRSLAIHCFKASFFGLSASSRGSTRKKGLDTERGAEAGEEEGFVRTLRDVHEQRSVLAYAIGQFDKINHPDPLSDSKGEPVNDYSTLITTNGGNIRDYLIRYDGTIKCMSLDVMSLLQDLRINLSRLGMCPGCDRIFWKKKADSKTCGRRACAIKRDNKLKAPERRWKRKERLNVDLQEEK